MKVLETIKTDGQWERLTDREQAAYLFGLSSAVQFLEQEGLFQEHENALDFAEKVSVFRYSGLNSQEMRNIALVMSEAINETLKRFQKFIQDELN